jgi:DNA-binding response OmpR family regulator
MSSQTRVLILDDEPVIANTLRVVLERQGFVARAAFRHEEAVAIARDFQPDVLIAGFNNSSEKNGCETAEDILSFVSKCRILIFSGQAKAAEALNEFRERGFDFEVLPKPCSPDELLAKLLSPHKRSE